MGWWAEGPIENADDLQPALQRAVAQVKNGKPALVDAVTQHRHQQRVRHLEVKEPLRGIEDFPPHMGQMRRITRERPFSRCRFFLTLTEFNPNASAVSPQLDNITPAPASNRSLSAGRDQTRSSCNGIGIGTLPNITPA